MSSPRALQSPAALLATAAIAAGCTWAILSGTAPTPAKSPNRYQYAEFRIEPQGERAVLNDSRTVQEIKAPDTDPNLDRSTVFENAFGRFTKTFNLLLYYQNVLGADGWEFSLDKPIKAGEVYLVRRRVS